MAIGNRMHVTSYYLGTVAALCNSRMRRGCRNYSRGLLGAYVGNDVLKNLHIFYI